MRADPWQQMGCRWTPTPALSPTWTPPRNWRWPRAGSSTRTVTSPGERKGAKTKGQEELGRKMIKGLKKLSKKKTHGLEELGKKKLSKMKLNREELSKMMPVREKLGKMYRARGQGKSNGRKLGPSLGWQGRRTGV